MSAPFGNRNRLIHGLYARRNTGPLSFFPSTRRTFRLAGSLWNKDRDLALHLIYNCLERDCLVSSRLPPQGWAYSLLLDWTQRERDVPYYKLASRLHITSSALTRFLYRSRPITWPVIITLAIIDKPVMVALLSFLEDPESFQ